MTDLETMRDMLTRAKIAFTEEPMPMKTGRVAVQDEKGLRLETTYAPQPGAQIKVEGGYMGFFTLISFDEHGALKQIGAWE